MTPAWVYGIPWSLSDSMSSKVCRTLLNILADLNKAVVCVVSTRSLISYWLICCLGYIAYQPL